MLHPHISNSSLSVPQHFLLLISIPCTGKKRDRKIGFYMKQNSQKLMPDHEMTFFFCYMLMEPLFVCLHLTLCLPTLISNDLQVCL